MRDTARHLFLANLLFFFAVLIPLDANVEVRSSVSDTQIPSNGRLLYTISVKGDSVSRSGDPIIRVGKHDFHLLNRQQSLSIQTTNGVTSTSKVYRYQFRPLRKGEFRIPPATVVVDNVTYETSTHVVTVGTANAQQSQTPSSLSLFDFSNITPTRHNRNESFARASVTTTNIYVGQHVIYELGFYRSHRLLIDLNAEFPSFDDFWTDSLVRGSETQVEVNGRRYYYLPVLRKALFPLQEGTFDISSARLGYVQSLFEGMKLVTSNPISIDVIPLPELGKPEKFSGLVGDFSLSARLINPKPIYPMNAPITMRITVSGEGNLRAISELSVVSSNAFSAYLSSVDDNFQLQDHVRGNRRFDYLIVPRESGELTIPSFSLDYFSPIDHTYKRIETTPFIINVQAEDPSSDDAINLERSYLELPVPDASSPSTFWFEWVWLRIGGILAGILLMTLYLWSRYFRRPKRRIHQAYQSLGQQLDAFIASPNIDSASRCRYGCLTLMSVYISIPLHGLSIEDMCNVMSKHHVQSEIIDHFRRMMIALDEWIYSPSSHRSHESIISDVRFIYNALSSEVIQ